MPDLFYCGLQSWQLFPYTLEGDVPASLTAPYPIKVLVCITFFAQMTIWSGKLLVLPLRSFSFLQYACEMLIE